MTKTSVLSNLSISECELSNKDYISFLLYSKTYFRAPLWKQRHLSLSVGVLDQNVHLLHLGQFLSNYKG